ncbi:hypothetical protein CHS0354_001728, partial [Potamilus streckersoni]
MTFNNVLIFPFEVSLCDHRVGMSNRSSNNACFECCDTDLCNAQACGEPGDNIIRTISIMYMAIQLQEVQYVITVDLAEILPHVARCRLAKVMNLQWSRFEFLHGSIGTDLGSLGSIRGIAATCLGSSIPRVTTKTKSGRTMIIDTATSSTLSTPSAISH